MPEYILLSIHSFLWHVIIYYNLFTSVIASERYFIWYIILDGIPSLVPLSHEVFCESFKCKTVMNKTQQKNKVDCLNPASLWQSGSNILLCSLQSEQKPMIRSPFALPVLMSGSFSVQHERWHIFSHAT